MPTLGYPNIPYARPPDRHLRPPPRALRPPRLVACRLPFRGHGRRRSSSRTRRGSTQRRPSTSLSDAGLLSPQALRSAGRGRHSATHLLIRVLQHEGPQAQGSRRSGSAGATTTSKLSWPKTPATLREELALHPRHRRGNRRRHPPLCPRHARLRHRPLHQAPVPPPRPRPREKARTPSTSASSPTTCHPTSPSSTSTTPSSSPTPRMSVKRSQSAASAACCRSVRRARHVPDLFIAVFGYLCKTRAPVIPNAAKRSEESKILSLRSPRPLR